MQRPNERNDDDDQPEIPARDGFFADAFRQHSTGPDEFDNGLPESHESITQSRPPHGNEAAGTSRSIGIVEGGPELRSISMMTSTESLLSGSPFDLHPAPASAPTPMRAIVANDDDFFSSKFASTMVARPTSEFVDTSLSLLQEPFSLKAPTMLKQKQTPKPTSSPAIKIILTPEQQAKLIPNPTKATFTPPSMPGMEIRIDNGWGPSGVCFVRNLPTIYPNRAKIVRDYAFPLESLAEKTRQIQMYNKTMGFQVIYQENPLRATVQTPDCGEFILDFWVSSSSTDFYLALYAKREVGIETQVQMDSLLKALKEDVIANMPLPTRQAFDRTSLERLESYLDSSVQSMEAKRAKTTVLKRNVLAEIHQGLTSESLEQRNFAMSLLLHGTDLKSTLGSFACRVASVVLTGSSLDQAELDNSRAMEIHKVLIHILQEAEFVGDAERFQESTAQETATSASTFHPMSNRKRPRYYEDFMADLHNMAMTILVQALEVAVCFDQHKDLIQQFVANYYFNGAMNAVLERCIFQVNDPSARHSLSKGYLACKALRILAESNAELRKQVGLDDRTKSSILGALEVGESSHWLLHRETKDLHNLIYGQM